MTNTQVCALAAGLALLAVAPAFAEAADLGPYRPASASPKAYAAPPPPPSEPLYEPGFSWTGGYFGFSAGYGWGDTTLTYDRAGHGTATSAPDGVLGAFTLGYNTELPSGLTLGVEGDLGLMDLQAQDKVIFDGHLLQSSYGDWWGTIRGRLGVAAGRTLFYGTGGAAFMDLREIAVGNTPQETAINEEFKTGWVVGGGIEHAISPHMTAKIEYLHMDFGKYDGVSANNEAFSFDNTVDIVRAGINYKF